MALIGVAFGLGFILGPVLGGLAANWGAQATLLKNFGESTPALLASLICFTNFIAAYFLLKESLKPENQKKSTPRKPRWEMIYEYFRRPFINKLLFVQFAFTLAMANMEASLFLFMKDKFSWSLVDSSLGFAYIGVVMVLVQGGLIRRIVPKFGELKVLLMGLMFTMLGFWGMSYSSMVPGLAVFVTIMAIGASMINPTLSASLSLLSDSSEQGAVLGTGQSLSALGRVLGPVLGGWVYRDWAWEAPLWIAGFLSLICFLNIRISRRHWPQLS
jgi:MFS family permease